MQFTEQQILVAARVLSDRTAKDCNVNKDDNWDIYCENYIDDARAALTALSDAALQVVADDRATLEDQSYAWMAEQQIKGRAISETQRKIYLEGLAAAPVQAQEPIDWKAIALFYQDLYSQEKHRAPVQPVAVPDSEEFGFKAVRLRRTAFLLGLEGAIPDNDKDLMDCMGAVLGMICREVEHLAAPAAQGDAKDAERLNAAIYEGITKALGEYRMSNMCFADDESMPFPLVDLLSKDGGTIESGQQEIVYITDAVYNEVVSAIAAKAAS